jgi:cell division initiation protein
MRFSSDDILKQKFQRRLRGVDELQVREFLDGLAREWDHLSEELKRSRAEAEAATRELKEYRRRERSLQDALDMARQVAEDVRGQAERDAELIVAEAELKSERILAGVEARLRVLREEMIGVQHQRIRFEAELRASLEAHRKMLDVFSGVEVDDSDVSEVTSADMT